MASSFDKLTLELERIISAPYLISFEALHLILQECTPSDIRQWADTSPGNVLPLAEAMNESLLLWSRTSDIIVVLLESREFHHALLFVNSCFLHTVVQTALQDPSMSSAACQIARKMLSTTLPKDAMLPASAQTLFSRFLHRAATDPTASHVEVVYDLVCGACCHIPQFLESDEVDGLLHALKQIMRSVKHWKDQEITFYCLNIMLHFKDPSHAKSSAQVRDSFASLNLHSTQQSNLLASDIDRYFTGLEAAKLTELLTLHVINSCNPSTSPETAKKMLTLCRKTLSGIDSKVRAQWSLENQAHIQKLCEKISKACDKRNTQLEGCAFEALLDDSRGPSANMVKTVQDVFNDLARSPSQYALEAPALESVFAKYSKHMTKEFWQNLLLSVAGHLVGDAQRPTNIMAGNLLILLKTIAKTVTHCESLCCAVLECFLSKATTSSLADIFKKSYLSSSEMCARGQLALDSQFAATLMLASFRGLTFDYHDVDLAICHRLIDWQQSLLNFSLEYKSHSFRERSPNACLISPTPTDKEGCSRNWRANIRALLDDESSNKENRLIDAIAQICRDLESRCNEAELPLREEQQKCQDIEMRLEDLKQENDDFHEQLELKNSELSEARRTVKQVENDLMMAVAEIEEQTTVVARLKEAIKISTEEHENYVEGLETKRSEAEIDLRHQIAVGTEIQTEQKNEIEKLQKMLSERDGQFHDIEQALQISRSETDDAKALLESEGIVASERASYAETLASDLEKARRHILELEESGRVKDADNQRLKDDHKEEMDNVTLQQDFRARHFEEERGKLEGQIEDLQAASDLIAKKHAQIVKSKDNGIEEAQKALEKTRAALKQKEVELSEAQTLKKQLANLMGLDNKKQESSSRRQMATSAAGETFHRKEATQAQEVYDNAKRATQTLGLDGFVESFDSSTSSNGSGPTPKRMRPQDGVPSISTTMAMSRRKGSSPIHGSALQDWTRTNTSQVRSDAGYVKSRSRRRTGGAETEMSREVLNEFANDQENLDANIDQDGYGSLHSGDFDTSITEL